MIWLKLSLVGIIIGTVVSKRSYNLRVEKLQFPNSAEKYIKSADVTLSAYNESTTLITGPFELASVIPNTAWVMLLGFEQSRTGNDFQSFATINRTINFCDFLETDRTVIPEILQCSNIIPSCPFPLQQYTLNNCLLEGKSLPDDPPGQKRWRFELWAFANNSTSSEIMGVAQAYIYFEPI